MDCCVIFFVRKITQYLWRKAVKKPCRFMKSTAQGLLCWILCCRVWILIVSAKTEKEDKLNGLILGADDYIEKPYDIDIMLAKIGGIFKRRYAVSELTDGNIRINKISRTVYKNGTLVEMTSKEFNLLVLLMENKGKALSKEYIFNQIWGSDSFSEQQTLTVHIKWLRQKIEDDPKNPKKILTVWGVGYKYESV